MLLHPDMPVGDAMFHAHRFQGVLAGKLYFTSIAPGGYLFPYAPGFYVFASPFASLVSRGADDMALLRVAASPPPRIAALLLYVVIVKRWGDRIAGAIAVALLPSAAARFRIMTVGNLTNAFAQSLSVVVLTVVAAGWVRWERPGAIALLTIALSAAFMSHTSTFAILFAATCHHRRPVLRGVADPALRSPAAAIVARDDRRGGRSRWSLYYAHFMDTYRAELATHRARDGDSGGRCRRPHASAIGWRLVP